MRKYLLSGVAVLAIGFGVSRDFSQVEGAKEQIAQAQIVEASVAETPIEVPTVKVEQEQIAQPQITEPAVAQAEPRSDSLYYLLHPEKQPRTETQTTAKN